MTLRRTVPAALLALLAGLLAPTASATASPAAAGPAVSAVSAQVGPSAPEALAPREKKARGTKTRGRAVKGKAWPRGRIRYVDLTDDSAAVRLATGIWNRSGVGVKFLRTTSTRRAQLVLRDAPGLAGGCGTGAATLGWPGRTRRAYVDVRSAPDTAGQRCATPGQALTLVRMLGRVMGLKDDDGACAAMNSKQVDGLGPSGCLTTEEDHAPGRWMCRPLTSRDLGRARRMYGGKPRPVAADPWCDLVAPMPATGALTLTFVRDGVLEASLQRLPEPALPDYLLGDAYEPEWELHQTVGGCTAVPGDDATFQDGEEWSVDPGEVELVEATPVAAGPVCFTAFAVDGLGRYARAGSSVVVDVPSDQVVASGLPG